MAISAARAIIRRSCSTSSVIWSDVPCGRATSTAPTAGAAHWSPSSRAKRRLSSKPSRPALLLRRIRMLERAREVTRNGKYSYIEYARFADDLVILIDAYKRHDWLI